MLRTNLHWILLVVCETVALLLLFHGSLFHSFVGAATASSIVGRFNEQAARVRTYLSLQQDNEALTAELAAVEGKYLALQRQLEYMTADTVSPRLFALPDSLHGEPERAFSFVTAQVVSMSHLQANNVMVINRGSRDGVAPNMGVVAQGGVAGIVSRVSRTHASVVPLVNERMSLSCMTLRGGYVGNLQWRQKAGLEQTIVTGLPKHAKLHAGDSIVTSGYSAIFPQGLFIGRLHGEEEQAPIEYRKELPVDLATDFSRLHYVYVITDLGGLPLTQQTDSLMSGMLP